MKRPVIGITVDSNDKDDRYVSTKTYAESVAKAGGCPILFPYDVDHSLIPQYLDMIDGMLFSGGADLDPKLYSDEAWHDKVIKIDPARQKFELALIAEVERRRLPTLGICLGSQVLNVHRGGALTQFLPDYYKDEFVEHRKFPDKDPTRHPVKVDTSTQLGKTMIKPEISVNTYHKQGVKNLGKGLRVVATAPDGLIEAFEDPSFPLLAAVQWHPERLNNEPEHLGMFKLLVEKSTKRA